MQQRAEFSHMRGYVLISAPNSCDLVVINVKKISSFCFMTSWNSVDYWILTHQGILVDSCSESLWFGGNGEKKFSIVNLLLHIQGWILRRRMRLVLVNKWIDCITELWHIGSVCTHTDTRTPTHTHAHTHTHPHTLSLSLTLTHTHLHTYTLTHLHTYTHKQT